MPAYKSERAGDFSQNLIIEGIDTNYGIEIKYYKVSFLGKIIINKHLSFILITFQYIIIFHTNNHY